MNAHNTAPPLAGWLAGRQAGGLAGWLPENRAGRCGPSSGQSSAATVRAPDPSAATFLGRLHSCARRSKRVDEGAVPTWARGSASIDEQRWLSDPGALGRPPHSAPPASSGGADRDATVDCLAWLLAWVLGCLGAWVLLLVLLLQAARWEQRSAGSQAQGPGPQGSPGSACARPEAPRTLGSRVTASSFASTCVDALGRTLGAPAGRAAPMRALRRRRPGPAGLCQAVGSAPPPRVARTRMSCPFLRASFNSSKPHRSRISSSRLYNKHGPLPPPSTLPCTNKHSEPTMLSILAQITVLCALVAAQCDPVDPSPSNPGPSPSTPASIQFHPAKSNGKCIDVEGANFSNGAKVQIYDCNGTGAQNFDAKRGPTQIKVSGQNFCLDAGTDPKSGSKVHLWQCYPGLKQQSWYITGDNRLALENQGLCLDLTDGNTGNGNGLQVWECGTGNQNQEWKSNLPAQRRRRSFN